MCRMNEIPKAAHSQFTQSVADAYNQYGQAYHEARKTTGLFYNECLEVPATLSLLPSNISGLSVLDAGCGSGLFATRLAQQGAQVVGVDLSEMMIQLARRESPAELGIRYQVGDLCATGLEAGTFDWVVSNYVLENVVELPKAFAEFARVLKTQGFVLLSVSHPIRATAKREVCDGRESWVLDDYFLGGTRISDLGHGLKVPKIKHTISDYLSAAFSQGFQLEQLLEPRPIARGFEVDPVLYDTANRLPQLLVLTLRKVS